MAYNITEENVKKGVKQAGKDQVYLEELLELIGPEKQKMPERELASQIVMKISQVEPQLLYPKWSIFIDFLKEKNVFTRLVAHIVISSLIAIDTQNFIDQDLDKFLRIIHDESIIASAHGVENFPNAIKHRPDLEQIITTELLETNTRNFTHKHKELLKGSVIKAFMEYYDKSNLQKEIKGFVKAQTKSSSGKTKKLAKEFIKKFELVKDKG